MGIYNFQYDPRTDPDAYFARGFENMVGGLLQGQQRGRLMDFAGGMDPNANPMQTFIKALSSGMSPQMAMGMATMQQRNIVSPHQRISEKKLAMIEQAEAEGDMERVERLMGVRKELEGKTKEDRIKILQSCLNAAAGQYFYQEGLEGGAEQPKNPVLYDYYADLLREEGIPVKERPGRPSPKTPTGEPTGNGKPPGPEVPFSTTDGLSPSKTTTTLPTGADILGGTVKSPEPTPAEINSVLEGLSGQERMKVFQEGLGLRSIWGQLTKEEKLTAYEALSQGKTAQEVIDYFSRQE